MTANDFVTGSKESKRTTLLLYAVYLIAILVATAGWLNLLAWLGMELLRS